MGGLRIEVFVSGSTFLSGDGGLGGSGLFKSDGLSASIDFELVGELLEGGKVVSKSVNDTV